MKVLLFFLGFILTSVFSNIADSILLSMNDKEASFLEYFVFLLFSGTAKSIISHFFIYGIFFNLAMRLTKKAEVTSFFIKNILLIGTLYVIVVTIIDYSLFSKFKNWSLYIYKGNHYFFYVLTSVIVCILISSIVRSRNSASFSPPPADGIRKPNGGNI